MDFEKKYMKYKEKYLLLKHKKVNNNFNTCSNQHLTIDNNDLEKMRKLLTTFIEYADKYNLHYFIVGGTLLGSARNGGLMFWDDDIDVGIIDFDIEKINFVKKKLEEHTDVTIETNEDFGFGIKFKADIGKYADECVWIDVFVYTHEGDKIKLKYPNASYSWPNDYFLDGELYPLDKINFSDIIVNRPKIYQKYLDRQYKNWANEVHVNCGHKTCKVTNEPHGVFQIDDTNRDKYMCYTSLVKKN